MNCITIETCRKHPKPQTIQIQELSGNCDRNFWCIWLLFRIDDGK